MNALRKGYKPIVCLIGLASVTAVGCVAGGPLAARTDAQIDPADATAVASDQEQNPIRLVSFPSIDIVPLWPSEEETDQTRESVVAPLSAGAEAVQRGAAQVKQGVIDLGNGTRRAVGATTDYLSRPFVAVRATPGEPSLLQRLFWPQEEKPGPRTTGEFFQQERLR